MKPALVLSLATLALAGCGSTTRSHTVTRKTTTYDGTVTIPVPAADGMKPTPIPIHLSVQEDDDEDAEAETKTKLDPALQAALTAIAAKGGDALIPGAGSFMSSFLPSGSGGLGGLLPLVGTGATAAGAGLVALKKQREAEVARKATQDAVAFGQDALEVDPKDEAAMEALKEKHRLRQLANGTNAAITEHI